MKKHLYGSVNIAGTFFSLCNVQIGYIDFKTNKVISPKKNWATLLRKTTCKNCTKIIKSLKKKGEI